MRRVLLVGEGDFTFALALCANPDLAIVATSLESYEALAKYRDIRSTLSRLKCEVRFSVDATKIETSKFDDVIFTHPHLGIEDCDRHYCLLAHFFACVKCAAHVTLAGDQAKRWRIEEAAKRQGLVLVSVRDFVDLPGYTRRRCRASSFRRRAGVSKTYTFTTGRFAEPPWQCPRRTDIVCCGRAFIDERALQKHRQTHGRQRTVLCEICGLAFIDQLALTQHAFKHTETLRPDRVEEQGDYCDICGLRHLGLVPSEPAKLPCDVCSRFFADSRALRQHQRVHLTPPPRRCKEGFAIGDESDSGVEE